jgi:hypothetical protein
MLSGAHQVDERLARKLEKMRPEELDISLDKKEFYARIRAELHHFVHALARRDWEEALAGVRAQGDAEGHEWTEDRLEQVMAGYYADYPTLIFDPRARQTDKTTIDQQAQHLWAVRQTLLDPEDDGFWFIEAEVDLREDQSPEGPVIRILRIGT